MQKGKTGNFFNSINKFDEISDKLYTVKNILFLAVQENMRVFIKKCILLHYMSVQIIIKYLPSNQS